jgi:hypothetical protein
MQHRWKGSRKYLVRVLTAEAKSKAGPRTALWRPRSDPKFLRSSLLMKASYSTEQGLGMPAIAPSYQRWGGGCSLEGSIAVPPKDNAKKRSRL